MPRRERDLFDGIASFAALRAAAVRAAAGKRSKPGVAAFLANLETEVLRLERELESGRYRPGRYTKSDAPWVPQGTPSPHTSPRLPRG